jgi:Zn-dependent protease with chaperone function
VALTVAAAVAPALITWWSDRRLLGKGDDPALPELLASRRRTNVRAIAVAAALMIVFAGGEAAWGIPLLLLLLIAVAYPLRTRLLGETWGFGSYLWHTSLSFVAGFGFWIALAYTPAVVQWILRVSGPERWMSTGVVVAALLTALLAWEAWYPWLWLRAHAAQPLTRADLVPRFEVIVQRAGTVVPSVYSVGPSGSRFVNAVALPSARRPSVAMGNALLELLDADESTAIFAHEVAHFDHFTARRVRRIQLANRALIVLAVAMPLAATAGGFTVWPWLGWLWPLAVLVALVQRASKSQQHETESDLRAAALCGDPEALVRGLVKLHLHARIPRRWAVDLERAASHPSLVRRIQAIRAGGDAAEQLGAATVIRSSHQGSWVVFDDARVYWLEGVAEGTDAELSALRDAASSYRAVNYRDLAELRVAASGDERALRARTRAGDAWSGRWMSWTSGSVMPARPRRRERLGSSPRSRCASRCSPPRPG